MTDANMRPRNRAHHRNELYRRHGQSLYPAGVTDCGVMVAMNVHWGRQIGWQQTEEKMEKKGRWSVEKCILHADTISSLCGRLLD